LCCERDSRVLNPFPHALHKMCPVASMCCSSDCCAWNVLAQVLQENMVDFANKRHIHAKESIQKNQTQIVNFSFFQ
jgi:hypothetical protein